MVGVFFTWLHISFIVNKVFMFMHVVIPEYHDDQLKVFMKKEQISDILFFEGKCLVQGVTT
jgi:hypothetical protein